MKVDLFDFDLPPSAIAQHPVRPRDAARLLAINPNGGDTPMRDLTMGDLPRLLAPGDVLVFNDTRVIPARLRGLVGTAGVEVTLHKRMDEATWKAFARPAKKLKPGGRVDFAEDFHAEVTAKGEGGEVTLRFNRTDVDLMAALKQWGEMPLPPYIKRNAAETSDGADYQTIFAERDGAVAAPTAALHFTDHLLVALKAGGIKPVTLTLHVGAGTFLPIKTDTTDDHVMHAEWGEITAAAADQINAARLAGGRVVAVGTTALRLLETASDETGTLHPFSGETDIFIVPGYTFKITDVLLTNFHLPKSTLFMLVSAFAGLDTMKDAYAHAIDAGYRFYSYGDGSLLFRDTRP